MFSKRELIKAGTTACIWLGISGANAQENSTVPVIPLTDETRVTRVLLVGAFPHPFAVDQGPLPGKPERGGFDTDFLKDFGGEANAKIDGLVAVPFAQEDGSQGNAKVVAAADAQLRDFCKLLTPATYGITYALVDIDAEDATAGTCLFGSDDYAKVWLNGELVHEVWKINGRGIRPGEDTFPVAFKKGRNRVVFKIEQKNGGWGMDAEFLSSKNVEARKKLKIERAKIDRFRFDPLFVFDEEQMEFRDRILPMGKLPAIAFQNPELAAELADMDTFKVRWFDQNLDEVTEAKTPGVYCAYVEVRAKNGLTLRRIIPAYAPEKLQPWSPSGIFRKIDLSWRDDLYPQFSQVAWDAHQDLLRETLDLSWWHGTMFDAVPLFMDEQALDTAPANAWRVAPYNNIQNYLVQLRRKVLTRPPVQQLQPPVPDPAATALRFDAVEKAGFKPNAVEEIRKAAQKWCDVSSNGFVLVVARRGVVIMNEAFNGNKDAKEVDPNQLKDGKLTTASRLPTASVTKLHAGVLLARFIDQGLVDLDDPVSKFFPDFPANDPKMLAVRQLMNHTSGLQGHRWYMALEGMVNPFLDNVAWWDMQRATPGVRYNYNGFGIDLSGKIIEDITGRSVFDNMRDALFEPLGQDNPTIVDLGYGINCTAMDLARVAEMLRQEGAYNGKRYFSRDTFKKLLPIPVSAHNPNMQDNEEYGVGISWMRDRFDTASSDTANYILGPNVIGHGSATGAILRVAPDHELIVTMARYTPGDRYDQGISQLMQAIAGQLE